MAPVASETTTPEEAARIAAAVDTWLEDSNGHAETRTFALDTDKPGQALAEVLSRAELEFIGSGGVDKADSIPAELAFSALFAAASSGGAYDRGRYGAYGRLSAWQSVGGLVGANPSETIEAVAAMAEQSRWFRFDSEWFHHVAWDVGLAVVSADGARLALLAATDTD